MSRSLLQRVADGDPDAPEALVARYGGLVWSLARRTIADHGEAEDAVQEVFTALWRHADRFDAEVASEATFVSMIARRRLIDRRRRITRRPDAEAAGGDAIEAVIEVPTPPAEAVATGQEHARALAALEALRPEQRTVLLLSLGHGRTYEQIARSTGMPVGTVKTHARRGLIRVRELLKVGADDEDPDRTD